MRKIQKEKTEFVVDDADCVVERSGQGFMEDAGKNTNKDLRVWLNAWQNVANEGTVDSSEKEILIILITLAPVL